MAKPEARIGLLPAMLQRNSLPVTAIYANVLANAIRPSNEVAKNPLSLTALGVVTIILGVIASEFRREVKNNV